MKMCAAACMMLAALPVFSSAEAPSQSLQSADQLAIGKLEQRWLADIGAGDRGDLAVILADDYRDIDWRGQIRDKQTMLAAIHKSADKVQHIARLQVRVWGDTAVATGINQVHSASKGWTVEIPFTDVFARIDGHWRAVASQETLRTPTPANKH